MGHQKAPHELMSDNVQEVPPVLLSSPAISLVLPETWTGETKPAQVSHPPGSQCLTSSGDENTGHGQESCSTTSPTYGVPLLWPESQEVSGAASMVK